MIRLLAAALSLAHINAAFAADWFIVSQTGRAEAGAAFEVTVIAPAGEALPSELDARLKLEVAEISLTLRAGSAADNGRRTYSATMPASAVGPVRLQLVDRPSNVLALVVARRDAVQSLTMGAGADEPPLSENEPMYFVIGTRGDTTARFQLSFKYRLFDADMGIGEGRPWLSGLYFGYTQNSLWDLSSESKAFRDTSYLPALFWKWERTGERAFFDGARLGVEHESNGGQGDTSRSINIAFVRPEWRWQVGDGATLAFMPKLYTYLDKSENSDIDDYRGYADWRVRFDSGVNWIANATVRYGTASKGSLLLEVFRRTRDVKFGPVSGYFMVQFFAGYGEDILDYNVRRKSQLRFGFAIVP